MKFFAFLVILAGVAVTARSIVALRAGGGDRRRAVLTLVSALLALAIGGALYAQTDTPRTIPASSPSEAGADGSPGIARVCLTDTDVDLANGTIELPATTVLDDAGVLRGSRNDPASWETTASLQKAAILTLAPITLTQNARCSEVAVKMLLAPLTDSTRQKASENHVFTLANVLDYPIPTQKPVVEISKLVDDVAVKAILLSDVTGAVKENVTHLDEAARSAACLAGARTLAAYLKAGVGRETGSVVFIEGVAAESASYGCPIEGRAAPDLFVSWEGQARPSTATMSLISRGGAYLTGATPAEVSSEMTACVAGAMKPEADEAASREFRGVRLECQAYARDGGGGSVTLYRRFGTAPIRPDISPDDRDAMERASVAAKIEDERKAAEALSFAKWWQDPTIPEEVKTFAMMTARKIALAERCPTWKPSASAIQDAATSAGVAPSDLQPGGRYSALLANMLQAMRAGTAKESVEAACADTKAYR